MVRSASARTSILAVAAALGWGTATPAQLWEARDQVFVHDDGIDLEGAGFGFALAGGDWNGDGYSDLALGEPGYQDFGGGAHQFRGSVDGLIGSSSTYGIQEQRSGSAIAIGDFDDDGFDDFAVGEPAYVQSGIGEGRVVIYGGSASGPFFEQSLRQSLAGVPGAAEDGDEFGAALATGDFNGDGFADLAVGAPGEDVGALADAGSAFVFYGSETGLTVAGSQIWHFDSADVPESPAAGDRLGAALAAYRPDCDAFVELAIGVPGRTVGGFAGAGAVVLMNGTESGLGAPIGVLDESDAPISGDPRAGEAFGAALADAGNLDHASCGSLLVGAPGERVEAVANALRTTRAV